MALLQSWIGTSGFQHPEWKGKFYPENLPKARMLSCYASRFNSTEVNYTFRSIPSAKAIHSWCDETPAAFRFSLKAPQRITHFARLQNCTADMEQFLHSVSGLGGKLGPVLLQLPPNFKADAERLDLFLSSLVPHKLPGQKKLPPAPSRLAFEFRHESWLTDEIFEILSRHNTALCVAESEEFVTPQVATADFGYLRPRREDYSPAQLKQWADFAMQQVKAQTWSEVFIYFKHEETCVGPAFAESIMKLLGQALE